MQDLRSAEERAGGKREFRIQVWGVRVAKDGAAAGMQVGALA